MSNVNGDEAREALMSELACLPRPVQARIHAELEFTSASMFQVLAHFTSAGLAFARCLLLIRRKQGERVLWPAAPLALLLVFEAVSGVIPGSRRTADGRLLDNPTPSVPVLLARAILTAAPPARVPCQAGTAG